MNHIKFVICDMEFVICSNISHFSNFSFFRSNFVVISPGPIPRTRQAKLFMLESACETFFFKEDLRDIERKGYGVVFGTNASNHYCPTIVIPKQNYATWQLEQLSLLSRAQLTLIDEIGFNDVAPEKHVHLQVFKEQLATTVELFGPAVGAGTVAARAKAKSKPSGVLFTQTPGVAVDTPNSSKLCWPTKLYCTCS